MSWDGEVFPVRVTGRVRWLGTDLMVVLQYMHEAQVDPSSSRSNEGPKCSTISHSTTEVGVVDMRWTISD